jgi:hypothetical protein
LAGLSGSRRRLSGVLFHPQIPGATVRLRIDKARGCGRCGKEIVMEERGSDKHGPALDDQMKHEDQGLIQGSKPGHAEEFRETEPFPDETDSPEVLDALRNDVAKRNAEQGRADREEEGGVTR